MKIHSQAFSGIVKRLSKILEEIAAWWSMSSLEMNVSPRLSCAYVVFVGKYMLHVLNALNIILHDPEHIRQF